MEYTDSGLLAGSIAFILIISLAISLFSIICSWKIFEKAGQPGWAALIPFYNIVVFLKIINRPVWWIILLLLIIPIPIMTFILSFDLAKVFGKGTGFALGLVFLSLIFHAILAFGDDEYVGSNFDKL
jgi:hypothetical protein